MSISKAAKKAYVTQQCVSDHIKRLEQQHNIKLFKRRPRFQLTEAGEIMLQALRNIKILETNMYTNLKQISIGEKGRFIVGINSSRAQVILPKVLPIFHRHYPKVKISFFMEDTVVLEEKLLKGEIDLFIGVNAHNRDEFLITPLCDDEICLIVADSLLKKHFGANTDNIVHSPVNLSMFSNLPFSDSFKTGAVNQVMQEYLDKYHLKLKAIYSISDTDTQISLCSTGLCASISPKMLLERVNAHNSNCEPDSYIHVFPLNDLQYKLRIEVISHKDVVQPVYIERFIEILIEQFPNL